MQNFFCRRLTAALLIGSFTFGQISAPSQLFASALPPVTSEVSIPKLSDLSLPADLASVDASIRGQKNVLIHIQESHEDLNGQQKILEILRYLKTHYGIRQIFLEGSAGELHPELLRLYPQDMVRTLRIAKTLAKDRWLTGSDLFLLENSESAGFGIEDLPSYNRNSQDLVTVLRERPFTQAFLEQADQQINLVTSKFLNSKLKKFVQRSNDYHQNKLSLESWLSQMKQTALESGLGLEDPAVQLDWPMMVRLMKLKKMEQMLDGKALHGEARAFLRVVKPMLKAKTFETLEGLILDQKTALEIDSVEMVPFFESVSAELSRNFPYHLYPNVMMKVTAIIFQSEIRTEALEAELQRLEKELFMVLAKSKTEKEMISKILDYQLLKKAMLLELTPREWTEIQAKEEVEKIQPSSWAASIQQVNLEASFPVLNPGLLENANQTFAHALNFYRGADQRNGGMLESLEKVVENQGISKSVLITGGFHRKAFETYCQKKGWSYYLITPRLRETPKKNEAYFDSILRHYFEPAGVDESTIRDVSSLQTPQALLFHHRDPRKLFNAVQLANGQDLRLNPKSEPRFENTRFYQAFSQPERLMKRAEVREVPLSSLSSVPGGQFHLVWQRNADREGVTLTIKEQRSGDSWKNFMTVVFNSDDFDFRAESGHLTERFQSTTDMKSAEDVALQFFLLPEAEDFSRKNPDVRVTVFDDNQPTMVKDFFENEFTADLKRKANSIGLRVDSSYQMAWQPGFPKEEAPKNSRILFVRHVTTNANESGKILQGQSERFPDTDPSFRGVQEAESLAGFLIDHLASELSEGRVKFFVSPRDRVYQTFKPLQARIPKSNPNIALALEDLDEMNYGTWSFRNQEKDFTTLADRALNLRFSSGDVLVRPGGGETAIDALFRAARARKEIFEQLKEGETAVIISHVNLGRAFLALAKSPQIVDLKTGQIRLKRESIPHAIPFDLGTFQYLNLTRAEVRSNYLAINPMRGGVDAGLEGMEGASRASKIIKPRKPKARTQQATKTPKALDPSNKRLRELSVLYDKILAMPAEVVVYEPLLKAIRRRSPIRVMRSIHFNTPDGFPQVEELLPPEIESQPGMKGVRYQDVLDLAELLYFKPQQVNQFEDLIQKGSKVKKNKDAQKSKPLYLTAPRTSLTARALTADQRLKRGLFQPMPDGAPVFGLGEEDLLVDLNREQITRLHILDSIFASLKGWSPFSNALLQIYTEPLRTAHVHMIVNGVGRALDIDPAILESYWKTGEETFAEKHLHEALQIGAYLYQSAEDHLLFEAGVKLIRYSFDRADSQAIFSWPETSRVLEEAVHDLIRTHLHSVEDVGLQPAPLADALLETLSVKSPSKVAMWILNSPKEIRGYRKNPDDPSRMVSTRLLFQVAALIAEAQSQGRIPKDENDAEVALGMQFPGTEAFPGIPHLVKMMKNPVFRKPFLTSLGFDDFPAQILSAESNRVLNQAIQRHMLAWNQNALYEKLTDEELEYLGRFFPTEFSSRFRALKKRHPSEIAISSDQILKVNTRILSDHLGFSQGMIFDILIWKKDRGWQRIAQVKEKGFILDAGAQQQAILKRARELVATPEAVLRKIFVTHQFSTKNRRSTKTLIPKIRLTIYPVTPSKTRSTTKQRRSEVRRMGWEMMDSTWKAMLRLKQANPEDLPVWDPDYRKLAEELLIKLGTDFVWTADEEAALRQTLPEQVTPDLIENILENQLHLQDSTRLRKQNPSQVMDPRTYTFLLGAIFREGRSASRARPFIASLAEHMDASNHKLEFELQPTSRTVRYHTRAQRGIAAWPLGTLYRGKEADYFSVEHNRFGEKPPATSSNELGVQKIEHALARIDLWATSQKEGDTVDPKLLNLAKAWPDLREKISIIESDSVSPAIFFDIPNSVIRTIDIGRDRRVLYLPRLYLENFSDQEEDINLLATYLLHRFFWLHRYAQLKKEPRMTPERMHAELNQIGLGFHSGESFGMSTNEASRAKMMQILKQSVITDTVGFIPQVIQSYLDIQVKQAAMAKEFPDYKHPRKAIKESRRVQQEIAQAAHNLGRHFSVLGEDALAAEFFDEWEYFIRLSQKNDEGIWPVMFQWGIVLHHLRAGNLDKFLDALKQFLTGRNFTFSANVADAASWEAQMVFLAMQVNQLIAQLDKEINRVFSTLRAIYPERQIIILQAEEAARKALEEYREAEKLRLTFSTRFGEDGARAVIENARLLKLEPALVHDLSARNEIPGFGVSLVADVRRDEAAFVMSNWNQAVRDATGQNFRFNSFPQVTVIPLVRTRLADIGSADLVSLDFESLREVLSLSQENIRLTFQSVAWRDKSGDLLLRGTSEDLGTLRRELVRRGFILKDRPGEEHSDRKLQEVYIVLGHVSTEVLAKLTRDQSEALLHWMDDTNQALQTRPLTLSVSSLELVKYLQRNFSRLASSRSFPLGKPVSDYPNAAAIERVILNRERSEVRQDNGDPVVRVLGIRTRLQKALGLNSAVADSRSEMRSPSDPASQYADQKILEIRRVETIEKQSAGRVEDIQRLFLPRSEMRQSNGEGDVAQQEIRETGKLPASYIQFLESPKNRLKMSVVNFVWKHAYFYRRSIRSSVGAGFLLYALSSFVMTGSFYAMEQAGIH